MSISLTWFADSRNVPEKSLNGPSGAQFCEQLRQPLCLALLRNCLSDFAEAYAAATRLFAAVLLQPRLRAAAKVSLSSFGLSQPQSSAAIM